MKKSVFKSAFAIACVVAASVSGFKAYEQRNKNVAAVNMLLAENVEALSQADNGEAKSDNTKVVSNGLEKTKVDCTRLNNGKKVNGKVWTCMPIKKPGQCTLSIPNPCS